MSQITHTTVMLQQAIAGLNIQAGQWYVDATLGTAGHSQDIIANGGKLIAFDQDPQAIEIAKDLLPAKNVHLVHANFNKLRQTIADLKIDHIAGILFDFGTSALQLDDPARGFSFMTDSPLDMRMSPELAVSAKDLVNGLSAKELTKLLIKYGGEHRAKAIAEAITEQRKVAPIKTTGQLADIIMDVYQYKRSHLHPATKAFQALRIAVNDELNSIESTLPQIDTVLAKEGRVVTISFHEGEDRLVKHYFKDHPDYKTLTKKPQTPTTQEVRDNPRSRSAKLRIYQKQ